jgi:hypothetical protein
MVAHAFNLSTWEAEAGGFLSSRTARTARAIQRNPVSKKPKKKKKKKKSSFLHSMVEAQGSFSLIIYSRNPHTATTGNISETIETIL